MNGAADGTRSASVSVVPASDEVVTALPTKPLNLITIWGAARTGKSFFMNALTRKEDLFRVAGSMEPCTEGRVVVVAENKWVPVSAHLYV